VSAFEWVQLVLGGIGIGLVAAAPIGPVNLICIRRVLTFGTLNGFLAGTGAALGDGLFALVVAFGMTAVSGTIEGWSLWLRFVGAAVLIGMGLRTLLVPPPHIAQAELEGPPRERKRDLAAAIGSTFVLTVTNPATLFWFVAVFSSVSGLAIGSGGADYISASVLVAAVVIGSALWWLLITQMTGIFHGRLDDAWLTTVNHVAGTLILVFGVGVLGHSLWQLIVGGG
jgi:threonine/homoserine/homoserine lactone efflux protein